MIDRGELIRSALTKALRIRKQLQIPLQESLSPIAAAESLGIEVRFVDLPSMEGMYVMDGDARILLSALRPQGRRHFTCAHELGHHLFGHGTQFDELIGERTAPRKHDEKEFLADCFAAYFLMPKVTVENAMKQRGFRYQTLQPIEVYSLASWLGVGYRTLITHMRYGLDVILHDQMQTFLKREPRHFREQILCRTVGGELHIADEHWIGRAIDMEVGDYVLLPNGTGSEGNVLGEAEQCSSGTIYRAMQPGISRISQIQLKWSAFVRVSRKKYIGRSCFRFEEEVE